MAAAPDQSLPKQCADWADLKAAYRFLHHPDVTPDLIQSRHRQQTRQACREHQLVLAAQDTTDLDFTGRQVAGLGPLGDGGGLGMLQHSTLAVLPDGSLLGVLHQIFRNRVPAPKGEKRSERRARAKESDSWHESVEAVGTLGPGTRLVHVADRAGDEFPMMTSCGRQENVGFLIRARHDRWVNDGSDKLWSFLQTQRVASHWEVAVPATEKHPARVARLEVRFAAVRLDPPQGDPRFKEMPLDLWAVYLLETDAPAGVDPIEWMLLTSEAVTGLQQAYERVDWYTLRWRIEDWHKAEKTGCRLEGSQLQDAEAIRCLASFVAVIAVRMMQMRDLAQMAVQSAPQRQGRSRNWADNPQALQARAPRSWLIAVAHLAKCPPETLTPRIFWLTIAKRGGFIGRKSDGVPGWQTIWRGWYDVMVMVQGIELGMAARRE